MKKTLTTLMLSAIALGAQALQVIDLTTRVTNTATSTGSVITIPGLVTNAAFTTVKSNNVIIGDTLSAAFAKVNFNFSNLPAGGGSATNAVPIFNGGATNLTVTNTFRLTSTTPYYSIASYTITNLPPDTSGGATSNLNGTYYPAPALGAGTLTNSDGFVMIIGTTGIKQSAVAQGISVSNGIGTGIYNMVGTNYILFTNAVDLSSGLIPTLTSSNAPSGLATASNNYYANTAYLAYSNTAYSGGGTFLDLYTPSHTTKTAWIQYQFSSQVTVSSLYGEHSFSSENFPIDFVFQGSSNGTTWTNLFSKTLFKTVNVNTFTNYIGTFQNFTGSYFRWNFSITNYAYISTGPYGYCRNLQVFSPKMNWAQYATNAWRFYSATNVSFTALTYTVTGNLSEMFFVTNVPSVPPGGVAYVSSITNYATWTTNTFPIIGSVAGGPFSGISDLATNYNFSVSSGSTNSPSTNTPPAVSGCNVYVIFKVGSVVKCLDRGTSMWDSAHKLNQDTGLKTSYLSIDSAGTATFVLVGSTAMTIPWTDSAWSTTIPSDACSTTPFTTPTKMY